MRPIPTALALCLACGSAFAQQDSPQLQVPPGTLIAYSEYDVNGDSQVTTAEFLSLLPKEIKAAGRACDADADGLFSEDEYQACASYEASKAEAPPR